MDKCNNILKKALKMSGEMKELAIKGEKKGMDIDTLTLCGMIHTISTKISLLAEKEISDHKSKGKWK